MVDADGACVHVQRDGVCACMQTQMSVKKKNKKLTRGDLLTEVDGGHGVQMHCVWMPTSVRKKKKKEDKKTYLRSGHADADALGADANVYKEKEKKRKKKKNLWSRRADADALRADMDGGSCKKEKRETKKEEEKKTYLRSRRANADALHADVDDGSCRGGADECKEKTKKYLLDADGVGCGWWLKQMSIKDKEEKENGKLTR